jgi:hypothetical protein
MVQNYAKIISKKQTAKVIRILSQLPCRYLLIDYPHISDFFLLWMMILDNFAGHSAPVFRMTANRCITKRK